MQDPLSIWRVELLHSATVHIPIALLIFGTLLWISSLFLDKRYSFLRPSARLTLFIGTVGAWIAIYTGILADGQVARTLCDPTVAEEHEHFAFIIGYFFSAFVIVDLLQMSNYLSFFSDNWLRGGLAVLLIAGCGLIGYVGHSGAQLVYQQSAAVYQPTEGCVEFE